MSSAADSVPTDHVAIVGGGFSGAMMAVELLRHEMRRVTLVERCPVTARGTAYSTVHADHLLNVRADNMSAFADDPDHFTRWLERKELGGAADYIPRMVYGDYLAEILGEAAARSDGRLTIVHDEVRDLDAAPDAALLRLAGGRTIAADAAILAIGNLPPHDPPELVAARLPADQYATDPWAAEAIAGLGERDSILILGTGLTMIDVALMLDAGGFSGAIYALSRRGLVPRAHLGARALSSLPESPGLPGSDLVRSVRKRGDEVGWRAAVDALRPHSQSLWLSASTEERSRFLRHLRPWWEVHRHRIAPRIAERIEAMRRRGQLRGLAGRILDVRHDDGRVAVDWRPRGGQAIETLSVRRIVNCTGPQGDLLRTGEPLLRRLLEKDMIRPDAQRLGIDVNLDAEAIAADGEAQARLLAIGPMTRGAFWEIVAVPDIRIQCRAVARRLAGVGEGI